METEEAVQPDAGAAADVDTSAPETGSDSFAPSESSVPEEYRDRFTETGWGEYTKLRHENAEYRQRYQPYEEAFGHLDPVLAEGFTSLGTYMGHDPYGAAEVMHELLDAYGQSVGYDPSQRYAPQQPEYGYDGEYYEDPNQAPMTRAEHAAWVNEMQQTQQTEATQNAIVSHAAELGYDPQTNPEGYERLILRALYGHNSNLDAAADALRAEESQAREQWQREFLASKTRDAAGTTVAPSDGGSPTGARQIHSINDGLAAAKARIEAAGVFP